MKKILFHTTDYTILADKVLAEGGFEAGEVKVRRFPDGERYQQILTQVEDKNVVLIGGTATDKQTLELYDLACTLVDLGARQLELVIPYFGYSTMERAVKPGEVVTAKARARLLSSIPRSNRGNRVYLFDLHTEGLPYYFEGALRAIHVYCKPLIIAAARKYGGTDPVLASTDAGRAKWVESLANDMGVDAAFVLKRRNSGTDTEVISITADVNNRTVVIYDDMIRSGGSLINAAKAYKQAGAAKIYVITTHGVFIQGSIERMQASGLIEKVICTDTHPNALNTKNGFVEVWSIAQLVSQQLSK